MIKHMAAFDIPAVLIQAELEELLERQAGVLSTEQLEQFGISDEFARARVRAGRWQRPQRRVYATFSGPLTRLATIWAALLRCGRDAMVSHETAAELDGVCDQIDERVHVTVLARRRVRGKLNGVRVHYAHRLPHIRHPLKSPPRPRLEETVLDLIDTSRSARTAAGWIVNAIQRRCTEPSRLAAALAGRKKIKWRAMAEAMLLDVAKGARSLLEAEHLRRVERAHGLRPGHRQRRVAGSRVIWIDVDYVEYTTRVELDGRVGHQGEGAFRDRRRDNRGVVDRRATLRYGHAEVFGSPCEVAAEQAVVLQDRGWQETPRPCGPSCELNAAMARIRGDARVPA